jgi:hypothetical protein
VANRPGWQILDAVRQRRYAVVSEAIIRPAPRIVSVIEDLARQLHPEAFMEKPGTEKETPPANATPHIPPSNLQPQPAAYHLSAQDCQKESPCRR